MRITRRSVLLCFALAGSTARSALFAAALLVVLWLALLLGSGLLAVARWLRLIVDFNMLL